MLCARRPLRYSALRSWATSSRPSRRNLLTLAIETSCDDTAVAILEKKSHLDKQAVSYASEDWLTPNAKLLFNEKVTARNSGLGGIHPIEALESHQQNLAKLISRALQHLPEPSSTSNTKTLDVGNGTPQTIPDFISVTRGPGMRSNLACGLDTAKGLAVAWQIPLLGVHHMQAHALTPRLVHALQHHSNDNTTNYSPPFPFLTLLLSGGHTLLLRSTSLTSHALLATTHDVAIGDTLDKLGRLLLPKSLASSITDTAYARALSSYAFASPETYPSYPVPLTRAAELDKPPNRFGWTVPVPLANTRDMAFSFSGPATAITQLYEQRCAANGGDVSDEERISLSRAALGTCFEHISSRLINALESLRSESQRTNAPEPSTLVVSGGVASNDYLRWFLREVLNARGFAEVKMEVPPAWLCTDNAAMVAWAGAEMFEGRFRSALEVQPRRKWGMERVLEDGEYVREGDWWEG